MVFLWFGIPIFEYVDILRSSVHVDGRGCNHLANQVTIPQARTATSNPGDFTLRSPAEVVVDEGEVLAGPNDMEGAVNGAVVIYHQALAASSPAGSVKPTPGAVTGAVELVSGVVGVVSGAVGVTGLSAGITGVVEQ